MHAQAGDWLVVEGRNISLHARRGQILSVRSPDGGPPYLVRWADDGHEGLVLPGPDTHVVSAADQAKADAAEAERHSEKPPTSVNQGVDATARPGAASQLRLRLPLTVRESFGSQGSADEGIDAVPR